MYFRDPALLCILGTLLYYVFQGPCSIGSYDVDDKPVFQHCSPREMAAFPSHGKYIVHCTQQCCNYYTEKLRNTSLPKVPLETCGQVKCLIFCKSSFRQHSSEIKIDEFFFTKTLQSRFIFLSFEYLNIPFFWGGGLMSKKM